MYTELNIIQGYENNSSSAQQLLYTRYAPALKSVCMRYLKDKDDAKDVLHDSFIKIFNQIGKYKGEGSFEGWMKRMIWLATCISKRCFKVMRQSIQVLGLVVFTF